MILALVFAAVPAFTSAPVASTVGDAHTLWVLDERRALTRVDLASNATRTVTLEDGERLVLDSSRSRLLVLSQSHEAGAKRIHITSRDATTLAALDASWSLELQTLSNGAPVVRGEVALRVIADRLLLVVRVDGEHDDAELFTTVLNTEHAAPGFAMVAKLNGPHNGGSAFALAGRGTRTLIATTSAQAEVFALTPTGKLDAAFGDGGRVAEPDISSVGALVAERDGWVLAGGGNGYTVHLTRWTSIGRLDPSFGTGGRATVRARPQWFEHVRAATAVRAGLALAVLSFEAKEHVCRSAVLTLSRAGVVTSTTPAEPVKAQCLSVQGLYETADGVLVVGTAGKGIVDSGARGFLALLKP